jgi:uncharacterized protein
MIFQGEEAFGYSVQDVWNGLHDIKILTKSIPGCKSMKSTGDNTYAVAMSLGVAAVRGDYDGVVKVTDDKPLAHYVIEGNGKGAPGFVKLRMDCWFERRGPGTSLRWQCDATTGGLIASIGGKVLSGVSKYMAAQFFKSFRDELKKTATPTCEESVVLLSPAPAGGAAAYQASASSGGGGWLARFWSGFLGMFKK